MTGVLNLATVSQVTTVLIVIASIGYFTVMLTSDRVNAVEVTVDFQHRDKPHVEINVSAEHTQDFVASATAPTVVAALDGAIQKVEQQLRKHKEKLTGHKSTGVKHIAPVEEED